MLSSTQIRAARAMLNWSQNKLAMLAGLHINSLRNLENGSSKSRVQTDMKLRAVLEKAGIIFHGRSGVETEPEMLQINRITSGDYLMVLTKDILATLKNKNDELCTVTHDEMMFKKFDPGGISLYYKGRTRQKFTERCIVPFGGKQHSEKTNYRHLPHAFIGPVSWIIYKDRIALIHWDCNEGIIIRNRQIAATYQAIFEALWLQGEE
ncbi:MAG: helix-turn-helix domain-containing protein [Chitinophagia bacterium]|nr:helix-turn-helix domain-containing protein [Chitinophagia bacterium]